MTKSLLPSVNSSEQSQRTLPCYRYCSPACTEANPSLLFECPIRATVRILSFDCTHSTFYGYTSNHDFKQSTALADLFGFVL